MINSDWHSFLKTQGAQFENGIVQHFGRASEEMIATRDETVICDLSQFGILKISGEDAQSFLQGLCSNDIKAITPKLAQLNSLNTAKGRVLATFLVWQSGQEYFLTLPISLLEAIQKKLSMYVLRAKVKIENVGLTKVCVGITGNKAENLLQSILDNVPQSVFAVESNSTTIVIRIGTDRFQIITTPEYAIEMWPQLRLQAKPVGACCWDWLNIRSGIPVILPATQEQHVLQMINLDIIDGVSFKKGCYPGQEIVARIRYLGKVKQRTFLAHLNSIEVPQINDHLYTIDLPAQSCGSILNVAPAPQGGYDVLVTIQISTIVESKELHWKSADGIVLVIQDLPYAIPIDI